MENFQHFSKLLVLGMGEILSCLETTLTISEKEKYTVKVIDVEEGQSILQIKHPSGWVNGFVMSVDDDEGIITTTILQSGEAWQVIEKHGFAVLLHTDSASKQTEHPLLQQQNGNWSMANQPLAMVSEETHLYGLNLYSIWTNSGQKVAKFTTSPLSMALICHLGDFKLRFDYVVQA